MKDFISLCLALLSASDGDGDVRGVNKDGSRYNKYRYKRNGAVRPDLLLKRLFVNLENRSEKYILDKIYQNFKAKGSFTFLTAKFNKCGG